MFDSGLAIVGWESSVYGLENGIARCFDCIEQAIALRNHRVGGDHEGLDGLGRVDSPIPDLKHLFHVLGPVVADRRENVQAFLPNPSERLIRRHNPEIAVFDVGRKREIRLPTGR